MPRWSLQETMEQLLLHVQAGHPVIYIISYEEERVLNYLAKLMRVILPHDPHKNLLCWNEGEGLKHLKGLTPYTFQGERKWIDMEGIPPQPSWGLVSKDDPGPTLDNIKAQNLSFPLIGDSLTVFFDLHPFLRNDSHQRSPHGSLVRSVRNVANELRKYYDSLRDEAQGKTGFPYKTVVVVSPSKADFSQELERDVITVEFPLPEQEELLGTLRGMVGRGVLRFGEQSRAEEAGAATVPATLPAPPARAAAGAAPPLPPENQNLCDLIAGAGRGLTLDAYKLGLNGFAVRDPLLNARHVDDMRNLKANVINNPALQYTPHVDVNLAGLDVIKTWVRSRRDLARYESIRENLGLPALNGVMLCGVSGGGKSMLAKLIAKEFSLALLRLDVGALFGSFIGESEQRTREALQLAEVLAPIVLWLDEIDKAFCGTRGGGDNGVSARVFGSFLTWLAEKKESVFVVATANDFTTFLDDYPEFGRKGRFDEIFWVDLPDRPSRQQIFEIYLTPYFERKFLALSDQDIDGLAREKSLPKPEAAEKLRQDQPREKGEFPPPEVTRLCRLLGEPQLSGYMTGAEIEHAVAECAREVYNLPEHKRAGLEAGQLMVRTVESAKNRAMYKPTSDDYKKLKDVLRKRAETAGWPFVGDFAV